MKVISIGTDRKLFEEGSDVRRRTLEYGTLFEELHIIVFSKSSLSLEAWRIADNIWIYPTNSFTRFLYMRDAIKIANSILKLRKWDQKNAYITCQDPFETGRVGVAIKKVFKFPLQIQVHTDFLSPEFYRMSLLNKIRVKISRNILSYADSVRVVSERIKRSLVAQYLIADSKITVLPIYVDTERFASEPKLNLKRKYSQFSYVMLMASRLTPEKNISSAINMMAIVIKKYPKAGLVIVGAGEEETRLKLLVAKFGLQNSVIFEPWQNDLVSYYKTADVFLLSSLYEGYGMTLIEAGLSGAAIITSDVGIAGDVLKDGKNALIYPAGNTGLLTQKVLQLIENNDLRLEIKKNITEDVNKFILHDKNEYLQRYKSLMSPQL